MAWYDKYLVAFEHPFSTVPETVKLEVSSKLKKLSLIKEEPLASVVLIAHNEEQRILSCLWSLVDNICDFPIEIIIVNNNSTDATGAILDELGARWFQEKRKGPGFARQCGLDQSKGKYYICIDSDTMYPPYYISTHVRYLKKEGVVCTYGLWSFLPDEKHSRWGLKVYEFMRDLYINFQNIRRPELCVRGMVMAFRTELGRGIGFNTNIVRGEDGRMAFDLKKYGHLRLLRTNKVRPVTCNSIMKGDDLWGNFWRRVRKRLKTITLFFTVADEYKDGDNNKIDKMKK